MLEVKTFPETTKLAKALPDAAKLSCKSIAIFKLVPWCVEWAKTRYKKKLDSDTAESLIELVGTSMGMLDQELQKLASAVGDSPAITVEDVQRFVGRSKSADVFRILDAIGEGRPGEALSILEDLFAEGEDPMAILGPLTAQLPQARHGGAAQLQGRACRSAPRWTPPRCPAGTRRAWHSNGS